MYPTHVHASSQKGDFFLYVMILLVLYTLKIKHVCALMGFLVCQKFICVRIILFKGWVFWVTSPCNFQKILNIKIVIFKKFLYNKMSK